MLATSSVTALVISLWKSMRGRSSACSISAASCFFEYLPSMTITVILLFASFVAIYVLLDVLIYRYLQVMFEEALSLANM